MFHRSVALLVEFLISSPAANTVDTAGARTSRSSLVGVLALTIALSAQAQTLKPGAAVPRPILFVPNHGQAPAGVLWQAQGQGFEASFRRDGFALRIAGAKGEQNLSLVGIDKKSALAPLDPQPGKINFFLGKDPSHWVRGLPTFARLRYQNVYPGIDLLFYGNHGKLEYDFVVAPGANPDLIRLRLDDGSPSRITARGELQVGEGPSAVLHRPVLYQNIENGKRLIEGRFVRSGPNTVAFRFSDYDTSRTLIIDPALSLLYSTYLGGYHDDEATAIALDAQKNAYILGYSQSPNYPITGNAYQQQRANLTQLVSNIVLTKVDSSGFLLSSTFLGGSTGDTSGGIVLDSKGNAYITGFTKSSDFPVTANAYQTTFPSGAPSSAFLSELSPDGSTLVYSSFFGGAGGAGPSSAAPGFAIARNPQGNVVISGNAGPGLPTTSRAYLPQISTGTAAFVAVFNLNLSGAAQLVASTYYGAATPALNYSGTGNVSLAMALDSSGNPWIAGQSYTNNLPVTGSAYQGSIPALNPECGGGPLNSVGFFAKLSADLTTLDYASYLSGKTAGSTCSEYAHAIVLDGSGNVYVAGTTSSQAFPTTSGVFQPANPSGGYSEFVTKVSPDGTHLLWSTYLGGSGFSFQDSLAIDSQNNVWVSGTTQGGGNFPLRDAYQATEAGGYDGHITQFKSDGTAVLYSTYLGGSGDDVAAAIALDPQDNVYVAGYTTSTDFPVTSNAVQPLKAAGGPDYNGNDIFFSILGVSTIGVVSPAVGGNTGDTTITISGAGLQTGESCSLMQGSTTIAATAVTVASGGTSVSCTFALNGAATGSYNVVLSNPAGASLVETGAFSVQSGGQAQVWADIIGRPLIRMGVPSTFYVTFGNSGTTDAYFSTLWVGLPAAVTFSIPGGVIDLDNPASPDYTQGSAIVGSDGRIYLPFLIPFLPAGANLSLPIQITATSDQATLGIQAYVRLPWSESRQAIQNELSAALQNPASLPSACLPPSPDGSTQDCLGYWTSLVVQRVATSTETVTVPSPSGPPPPLTPAQIDPIATTVVASFQQGLATAIQKANSPGATPSDRTGRTRPVGREGGGGGTSFNIGIGLFQAGLAFGTSPIALGLAIYTFSANIQYNKGCTLAGETVVLNVTPCANGVQEVVVAENWVGEDCVTTYLAQFQPCDPEKPKPNCPTGGSSKSSTSSFGSSRLKIAASFRDPAAMLSPSTLAPKTAAGGGSGGGSGCNNSSSGGSTDPNDKGGPTGDGSASRYINNYTPLNYVVAFENQATATLPVAQAIVTDQLDPAKVDLSTLTLGSISFGSTVLTPPSGVNSYATTYSVNSSLSVRIQGSLNPDTGLLKWTFTTIDPSTGLPPSDPTLGFLPPDTDGVKGQAAVVFTVMPIAPLTTGTPIANQATVVFDANAPLNTPTWLNTIDANSPLSSVTALPATESSPTFTVSWSGSDVGSGIASFTIFVSDNGGTYTTWQTAVTATSASYGGQLGHTYAFYSVATDGAGNVQAPKSSPDTTTTIPVQAVGACGVGGHGTVTVADVQQVINEALGAAAAVNDLNGDEVVNVVDVQIVINAALNMGCYTQ